MHRYRDLDVDATLKDYDRAAALNPDASCQPCGPVGKKADLLRSVKRYEDAAVEYSRLLAIVQNPRAPWMVEEHHISVCTRWRRRR